MSANTDYANQEQYNEYSQSREIKFLAGAATYHSGDGKDFEAYDTVRQPSPEELERLQAAYNNNDPFGCSYLCDRCTIL